MLTICNQKKQIALPATVGGKKNKKQTCLFFFPTAAVRDFFRLCLYSNIFDFFFFELRVSIGIGLRLIFSWGVESFSTAVPGFGDKLLVSCVVYPRRGTTVLKGSINRAQQRGLRLNPCMTTAYQVPGTLKRLLRDGVAIRFYIQ